MAVDATGKLRPGRGSGLAGRSPTIGKTIENSNVRDQATVRREKRLAEIEAKLDRLLRAIEGPEGKDKR